MIGVDRVEPQPWRNGGGTTRELLAWPRGAAEWQLRISVADITRDGAFSRFDGIDRGFAVVDGAGVRCCALWVGGATRARQPAADLPG